MLDGVTTPDGSILFDGCDTIVKLWAKRCKEKAGHTAHREKEYGIWQSYSWTDFYEHARWIGQAFMEMGLRHGECVQILSEDRREWIYIDLAVASIGAIPTGVYTTDSADQLAYLVNDSQAKFLIIENDEQLDKFLEARDKMPGLQKAIVLEREGLRDFHDEQVMFYDELLLMGRKAQEKHPNRFEQALEQVQPEDTRMLVYTSGTTGPPKGAMITHRNMMFQLVSAETLLDVSSEDEQLCFLPLCHVLERIFSVEQPIRAGAVVNFAESPETVFDNLREVAPTLFTAVPRLWEKMYSRIMIMRSEATPMGRVVFDWAIKQGLKKAAAKENGKSLDPISGLSHALADWLVLSNIRSMLGMTRIRRGTTGAAPISPDLLRWFAGIGVPLSEGFGMTETAGVATVNDPRNNRIGTVGPALPGCEVKIAEDGEILIKGGNIFKGYWNRPEKTAETMSPDGYLLTGDIGEIDDNGCLRITGRKKDIIITAGGKNITPAEIESKLKFSPYISDAVVIGDKRKYLTCLIMIDQENVEKFAQDKQIPFSDFASLAHAKEVVNLIREVVTETNAEFARVEQIKDFRLIDVLLTAEDEELTPTMKLKRGFVEKRHKALIDQMY
ncbi:long-chain fatty acid--CoA ligase [Seohaeicola saemankumensis]|nr:long-chain fatty acid--CoA ligase [Seohaeicola saemankumensis]MCA0873527.1 long-chain fatty acid--CoA ligase [Seohaeicola saemankumensis]